MNRRRIVTSAVVAVAACAMALAAAAPASASVSHAFSGTIGAASSTPANPYPLSGPTDVAVDQDTGDIYVTDPGNYRVEKFSSTGAFLLMFGKGVDQTTGGYVCTAASGDTCQAGAPGIHVGQFTNPSELAVDNSGGPSNGDIYVDDTSAETVQKFDSTGNLITSFAEGGALSRYTNAIDLDPAGNLYTLTPCCGSIYEYSPDGSLIDRETRWPGVGLPGLQLDAAGNFYSETSQGAGTGVQKSDPAGRFIGVMTSTPPTTGFALDKSSDDLFQDDGNVVYHYSADCDPAGGTCTPLDSFGAGHLFGGAGLGVDAGDHTVYVADASSDDVAVFGDVEPIVTTGAPTGITESSVTLTGHIDPAGRGDITDCRIEFGFDKTYGTSLPCTPDPAANPPGSNFTGPTDVTATITGLSPGTEDHYRVVASNTIGATSKGADHTFITTQPPAVDGLASANLTATTADLQAQVNPNGLETNYRFEYGPTLSYGQSIPVPDGVIPASNSDQAIEAHLEGLVPKTVYHYRLVAVNEDGTTTAGDHTFNFYPPPCPNENVRQQTQADYLPDCRAYELVSPEDAAGTLLYPGGPNSGYATSPARFSYTGDFGTIPGTEGAIDGVGDLYVATRTDTGWVSKYVGLHSDQAAVAGGPPMGLPNSSAPQGASEGIYVNYSNGNSAPDDIQKQVLTDPSMDKFLDWNDGNQFPGDTSNPTPIASNAPYLWSAEGHFLGRWPTNLATVPAGQYPPGATYFAHGADVTTAPGGTASLDCPGVVTSGYAGVNYCPGDVTASSDLSHFVFATEWNAFAPGGQLSAPGSVYDNNTNDNTVAIASKTPGGDDIPNEPTDQAGDTLQIPAVSSDGSHILMAAGGTGPCGFSTCPLPPCATSFSISLRCPMQRSRLYMRVDGAVTYDVSRGHEVDYTDSTPDGSKVYFTTAQPLTGEDTDSSGDLYMWSEAGDSLTLVSEGNNGAGNSDSCNSSFASKCGVMAYSNRFYCRLASGQGGNCRSDNSIAENGDIYFFSPEQLDGSRGIPNQANLYDFRNGAPQYVTTLTTGPFCTYSPIEFISDTACSDTPVARMQVAPDDSHMAFVTASPVTQYDNAGHLEMYTFEPATGKIVCVSCIPSGEPPKSDVTASQNGLFMANDGRAFFATVDALVNTDTNHGQDVYEYVNGRPQLITPGTGDTPGGGQFYGDISSQPGLVGVSADGRNVYFSTYSTLVPADHNGLVIKFYDARAGGGFPAPPPPPGCAAADECHGAGSSPISTPAIVSKKALAGGNAAKPARHRRQHHKRSRKRHRRHHARAARRAGA